MPFSPALCRLPCSASRPVPAPRPAAPVLPTFCLLGSLWLWGCASPPAPPALSTPAVVREPPTVESAVPELHGLSLAEARERLRAAGLVLGNVETSTAPSGMVWHQSQPAGTRLAPGTRVDLTVVEESPNPAGCPAPDLSVRCADIVLPSHRRTAWHHPARELDARSPAGQMRP